MQLAATLNNPLKRSPGAYARAFLLYSLSGRKCHHLFLLYDEWIDQKLND